VLDRTDPDTYADSDADADRNSYPDGDINLNLVTNRSPLEILAAGNTRPEIGRILVCGGILESPVVCSRVCIVSAVVKVLT
jgi:hypothetical protein